METPNTMPSYYELLNVGVDSDRDEIETAYRQLIENVDTESIAFYALTDDADPAALRAELDNAYRTLCDPQRRAAYDRATASKCGDPDDEFPALVVVPDSPPALLTPPQEQGREIHAAGNRVAVDDDAGTAWSRARVSEGRGESARLRRRFEPQLNVDLREDTEFSGALLRHVRESAGAALEDLSDVTKISRSYLKAIEENDFAALPAPVYVRGFVTEYARAFGLDPRLVARSYMAIYTRYREETRARG